ncbi:hypothetical protein QWY84_18635 [Aquisalimonas lutea]|uniref:hypothetical protein n=1 Tax=Aquisalimonas lutea TaxID=1327750 RepID=UPI0025B59EE5|nr:hypothetical protein [Aquisalimonas lutea]MDN3519629.1 hypothetical protein [Aquisalimonas lutea]
MANWEGLTSDAQDVYVNLGTRNHEIIRKIETRRLVNAIRESQFVGYDKASPYNWLVFEYERRKTQRNWILGVVAVVVAAGSVVATAVF